MVTSFPPLQISALTVDCVETYRDAVCKTCDAVDANIKVSMNDSDLFGEYEEQTCLQTSGFVDHELRENY